MTYLSELFIDTLASDYSDKSVEQAVITCDEEFTSRGSFVTKTEICDFWDVYREFDDEYTGKLVPLLIVARMIAA